MKKELVTKIILWTQDALHTGKITGSDDEIAERCMKDIQFDALCDPDIYEANANEHFYGKDYDNDDSIFDDENNLDGYYKDRYERGEE